MNKKLIVLILFIFLLLSIVLISLLGKKPDPPILHASDIEFVFDSNDTNVNFDIDRNCNIVSIDVTNLDPIDGFYVVTYQLNYVIYPEKSIDQRVQISLLHSSDEQYLSISEDGLVTIKYTNPGFEKSFEIVIKSLDPSASSEAQDKVIITLERERIDEVPI